MIERYSRPEMKRVWSDENKFDKWLQVEIAACEAWAEYGAIPADALPEIRKARCDLARMNEILEETHHDVTAFLRAVSESIGEESRFIHLGLTSSDIMDTALALQLVEASEILAGDIAELTDAIRQKAIEHRHTAQMGRTHGVHAEPITFGLKMALWVEEMKRNAERFDEACRAVAVGKISGAVGTHATVPLEVEEATCRKLGLDVEPVSNQVVQRDRHAQYLTTLAILGGSLEKFATEIRGLQRTEVLEAEEPFEEGQTGSSAMPHKRNPELCERVCGIARIVRSYALTALENIALWHERDISHSSTERITFPDACLILDYAMCIFTYVMKGLRVYPERMKENIERSHGLVFSQRVMLSLVDKGLSREQAYKMVQGNAMTAWKEGTSFRNLLEGDPDVCLHLKQSDFDAIFDHGYFLRHVDDIFRRVGLDQAHCNRNP